MEPTEIAAKWKDQMQKGYLKMAVLLVLMRRPLHGYEIMKEIKNKGRVATGGEEKNIPHNK